MGHVQIAEDGVAFADDDADARPAERPDRLTDVQTSSPLGHPPEHRFGHLWGRSAPMQSVYEQISRVAATSITVFISGETGTGKELVAQTVHDLSRRRTQPFLAVNCGAISPQLMESEIFGHERGSFTGADRTHLGYFERASGGTLFLDEVTEMPTALQVKLLRVLETGRTMRVGSSHSHQTDVRVIAATNCHPAQAVASGKLREDLYYRLNVFPIEMPPLRHRLSDVPLLAQHFLTQIGQKEGQARRFSALALMQLQRQPWPGNVRELRNAVQRAYVMAAHAVIDDEHLLLPPAGHAPDCGPGCSAGGDVATGSAVGGAAGSAVCGSGRICLQLGTSMASMEKALILATWRHCHYQRERTAATLGISLKTLYNRLKAYGVSELETSAA